MKRARAVFTKVHNEPVFFPVWLSYYSRFFEPQDIYVLHTIRPTTCAFDAQIRYWGEGIWRPFDRHSIFDGPTENHNLDLNRIRWFQEELLTRYDAVLYTDADEIVHSPMGLGKYLDQWQGDVEFTKGFEVVHQWQQQPATYAGIEIHHEEPALDWSKPLLAQRHWWYYSDNYSKPILSRKVLNWRLGMHSLNEGGEKRISDELILIHLHKIDYKTALLRRDGRLNNEPGWKSGPYEPRLCGYQKYLTGEDYDRWWFASIDHPERAAPFKLMPEEIRGLL